MEIQMNNDAEEQREELSRRLDAFTAENKDTIESLKRTIQTQEQTQSKLVDAVQALQAQLDTIQRQSVGQQLADELISAATLAMDTSLKAYGNALQKAAGDADARLQQIDSVTDSFTRECKKHLSAVKNASITRISNGMAAIILFGVLVLNAGITYFVTDSFGDRLKNVENIAGAGWYNTTFDAQHQVNLMPYEWPAQNRVINDQITTHPNAYRNANDVFDWYMQSKTQNQQQQ